MPDCPVAVALADGAAALGEAELRRAAIELAAPVRVGVTGRPGAGRTTVTRALRGAGVETSDGALSQVAVYVFVERLTPEDRVALAAIRQPCVAVFNKADLAGFAEPGPMATAAQRCRLIQRDVGVPTVPLAGLAAAAAFDGAILDGAMLDGAMLDGAMLDGAMLDGVEVLAHDPDRVTPELRARLLAELDLFGVATAVRALRARKDIRDALRQASGFEELLGVVRGAAAAIRYRRAVAAVTDLAGPAADSPRIADFLAGDALVAARMAAAVAAVEASGLRVDLGTSRADYHSAAIRWQRYARGPVSDLHRACATDIARGALRLWAVKQPQT